MCTCNHVCLSSCMVSWLYTMKTHSCQRIRGNIMYNEYRYFAFLYGLIVSELPVIIDCAILRTITRQQPTYPSRASDDLLEATCRSLSMNWGTSSSLRRKKTCRRESATNFFRRRSTRYMPSYTMSSSAKSPTSITTSKSDIDPLPCHPIGGTHHDT